MLAAFDNPQGNYVAAAYGIAAMVVIGLAVISYGALKRAQNALQRQQAAPACLP